MDNYQQACGHSPVRIIECMILFGYTDSQGILLGDRKSRYEPWGSPIWRRAWFSSWHVISIDTGHLAQSPQSGPRWSPAFKIEPVLSVSSFKTTLNKRHSERKLDKQRHNQSGNFVQRDQGGSSGWQRDNLHAILIHRLFSVTSSPRRWDLSPSHR